MSDDNDSPLKRLRLAKRLTQEQLAKRIGKPRTMITAWESGGQEMSDENRALLARALGVAPSVLGPAWNPEGPRPGRRGAARGDTESSQSRPGVVQGTADRRYPLQQSESREGEEVPFPHDPVKSAVVRIYDGLSDAARLEALNAMGQIAQRDRQRSATPKAKG